MGGHVLTGLLRLGALIDNALTYAWKVSMKNLNDDDMFTHFEDGVSTSKPYIPWYYVEKSSKNEPEGVKLIRKSDAEKMIAERELAYRYNEGFIT